MIKYIVKKWILKQINDLLKDYQNNVQSIQVKISLWVGRLQSILNGLTKLLGYLDDNQLDDNEIDETSTEIKRIVQEW